VIRLSFAFLLLLAVAPQPSSGEQKAPKAVDGADIKPDGPMIRLKDEKGTSVEVAGCSSKDLTALRKLKADEWPSVFALFVERAGKDTKDQTPVLGDYQIAGDTIQFVPRYPLMRGVRYLATYKRAEANPIVAHFLIPKPSTVPTVVEKVYPTRDTLPENQLKFYLHFSAPMSRGEAYEHITLLNEDGKAVEKPFLTLDQELWDTDCKRFTLFLDPGRIKRGLKPREELGPALAEGRSYTLVIDRRWNDGNGEPLKETHRKSFKVMAPDDTQPAVKTWKIDAPPANTRTPLVATFPKSMDAALATRVIWVVDAAGKKIPGNVTLSKAETCWQFTPENPWKAGKYDLVADTCLEDLAGNSLARPFEVDVFERVDRGIQSETVKVGFEIK
jgi:hypothetical protein